MSLPIPNLDDKTFAQLVEEARALIPRYSREWTDYNLSDPGITFLELFAWLAEMQIYSLNRVRDEHYLKFLRLLNIQPEPAHASRVAVTFTSPQRATVEKGARLAATNPETGEDIIFETEEELQVSPLSLQAILTQASGEIISNLDANQQDGLFYFAFGENPRPGDALYLGLEYGGALPEDEIKIAINLYQQDLPSKPQAAAQDAEIIAPAAFAWEYYTGQSAREWKRLALTRDGIKAFARSGNIAFIGPSDATKQALFNSGAELYWVRCRVLSAEYHIPPRIDAILLHTIAATQGRNWHDELLGSSDALPGQIFKFAHAPVLAGTEMIVVKEGLAEDSWQAWQRVDDFDNSSPDDRHYLLNPAEGEIIFGDGIHGRIPPNGENNIKTLQYRSGGGVIGNARARNVNRILTGAPGFVKVQNHQPGLGGAEAEALEESQLRAKQDLRELTRAVTSEDYETLARATPGVWIARAKALPGHHPQYPCVKIPGAVSVAVIPYVLPESELENPLPAASLLCSVQNYLRRFRLLTAQVFAVAPAYVKVTVGVSVKIKPRAKPERVADDVRVALTKFLHPVTGGPQGEGWPFGYDVIASEVYQVIQNVAGVEYAERLALKPEGKEVSTVCGNLTIPENAVVYSGAHEIAVVL